MTKQQKPQIPYEAMSPQAFQNLPLEEQVKIMRQITDPQPGQQLTQAEVSTHPWVRQLQEKHPLDNLSEKIRLHWTEYRPKMVAELKAAGQLEQAIETAVTLTTEATFQVADDQNLDLYTAWTAVREMWAILPTEEDVPELGQGHPSTWEAPPEEDEG